MSISAAPHLLSVFHDVDITKELQKRPSRAPNYQSENQALVELAEALTKHPQDVLQILVEKAMALCHAGSAGVSLLENHQGHLVFRWAALAGSYIRHRNGFMLREASPCGVTMDRNVTQLMYMPERVFPMREDPRIFEALLIPFRLGEIPIGTVWIVTHDRARKFDREDERIVTALTKFASAGWLLWKAQIKAEEIARAHWDELTAASEMLKTQVDLLSNKLEQYRQDPEVLRSDRRDLPAS